MAGGGPGGDDLTPASPDPRDVLSHVPPPAAGLPIDPGARESIRRLQEVALTEAPDQTPEPQRRRKIRDQPPQTLRRRRRTP